VDQVDRDLIHVAGDDERIIGFYSLPLIPEPELDLMFVADDMQGSGLGRRLFDHMRAVAAAQGIAAIRIVSHPPSAGFYRQMGAVDIGVNPPTATARWERPILSLSTSSASPR
jgi:GNAT superfamily N-acetyltransferase